MIPGKNKDDVSTKQQSYIEEVKSSLSKKSFILMPEKADERKSEDILEGDWSLELNEGVPCITLKSLISGVLIGIFCSFLALFYSLKTGVIPSLNILCGLGGFLICRSMVKAKIFGNQVFTPQENAVIQTVGVAVYTVSSIGIGFASGYLGMSVNAYYALGSDAEGNLISDTINLTWPRNLLWCISLSFFGFFLAFPLRNYVILKQKLPFPSGTVTAYVIKNMHEDSSSTVVPFALMSKFFAISFLVGIIGVAFEGIDKLPVFSVAAMNSLGWAIDLDIGSFGIGAILSPTVNFSMLLGAIFNYALVRPLIDHYATGHGSEFWVNLEHHKNSDYYGMFSGIGVMLVAAVWMIIVFFVSIISDVRKKKQENSGAAVVAKSSKSAQFQELDRIFLKTKIPNWMPAAGYICFGALAILVLHLEFSVLWYQTLLAIIILPLLAISNIQGMGRTDWDISSTYGKMLMFPYGAWNAGQSIIPSLAVCQTTISGCSNAASLLQDFKTGYMLGASPTSMFIAQSVGAIIGCFVTPTFFLLLSSVFTLPNPDVNSYLPGRFGTVYRQLAITANGNGFGALPRNVLWIASGFCLLALVFLALQTFLPTKYASYVPEPSAMAVGMVVGPSVSIDFFIGCIMSMWWLRWNPAASKKIPYIASGCVAGAGFAAVVRCILSLASLGSPIELKFEAVSMTISAGQWVLIAVVSLVCLAVFVCGAWYWNQTDEPPAVPFTTADTSTQGETTREARDEKPHSK